MNKTEVLITGKKDKNFEAISKLIKNHCEWIITVASTAEEAIEKFHQQNFEVVRPHPDLLPRRRPSEHSPRFSKIQNII